MAAPALAITGITVSPTKPYQPADQVTAVSVHHFASGLGLTPQTLAAGLLVAGTAWVALAVAERSPKLALTGGILMSFTVLLAGLASACVGLMAGQTRLARTDEVMVRSRPAEPVAGDATPIVPESHLQAHRRSH